MLELLCRGQPSLIEPMIFRLAMRLGLVTGAVTGWPTSDHYRILRLAQPVQVAQPGQAAEPDERTPTGGGTPAMSGVPAVRDVRAGRPEQEARLEAGQPELQPLGMIELQEIPGGRTLVAIVPVALPNPVLESYVQALIQELGRLDFLAPPDRPKEPIGFHLEHTDPLEGARLLETFDAVNSVELRPPGLPAPRSPAAAPAPRPSATPPVEDAFSHGTGTPDRSSSSSPPGSPPGSSSPSE